MATFKACVLGSTGAVGSNVTKSLLASSSCSAVIAFVRRPSDTCTSDKLQQHVVDFDKLDTPENAALLQGCTVAFNCLGTGQPSKTPSELVYKTDVVYARVFGQMCKAAGVKHMSLLSGILANKDSRMEAARFKVEAEQSLIDLHFERLSIFHPSSLLTPTNRYGLVDILNQQVMPFIAPIIPSHYRPIKVEDLGRAMYLNTLVKEFKQVEYLVYSDYMRLLGN